MKSTKTSTYVYSNVYPETLSKIIEDYHTQIVDMQKFAKTNELDKNDETNLAAFIRARKEALEIYNAYCVVKHRLTEHIL